MGVNLADFQAGLKQATALASSESGLMSAEMKRTSREGAESWRLIDEALGIHISRPLTKIVTQEFPAFASALQSVLGVGVAGALAVAGFDVFEKISKSIEKAQKAQEELKAASENVSNVFAREMSAYKDKDKAVTAATEAVDRLAEAEMKQAKASQEASGWLSQAESAVGEFFHVATSFSGTLGVEQINKKLGEFKQQYDSLGLTDSINKTRSAAKLLADEFDRAKQSVTQMQDLHITAFQEVMNYFSAAAGHSELMKIGFTDKEIDAAKALAEALQKIQTVQDATSAGVQKQEAQAAALERQKEAAAALADLYRSMSGSIAKLQPVTDPLDKLRVEIRQMKESAENDFRQLAHNSDQALQLTRARATLKAFESDLDRVFAKAKADADLLKATAELPTKIAPTGAAPQFPTANAQPTLGAGGSTAAQLDTFTKDLAAQLKLAAQAYEEVVTPQQKYQLAQSELNLLLKQGLIDQNAFTAAMQKAREEMAKATDQMEKLLKEGGAAGGFKAFMIQLQGQGSKGSDAQFTFDLLNKGLQGFEDQTVKALTGAKTSWRSYFLELDQMALKFLLNKEISSLLKMFSNSSFGKSLGLPNIGGASQATTTTANTTAVTSNTTALIANTQALISASAGGAAGAAGGGGIIDIGNQQYASGTDFAPGGISLVGEDGPELVNLPTGSSVTPNSALRAGSPTVHVHIDARGGEIGVEDKIARAISSSAPHIIMRAVVEASEIQRRTPR
jgi:hypothetical protein